MFFVCTVEARGRASTLNRSGRKRNRRERGETPTAELKAKIEGDLDKQWGVGKNHVQERMHGVDKMDTEGNAQDGKLELWKEELG